MGLNDKEKKKLIALTRRLKEEKGITIKKAEIDGDIQRFRKAQEEIQAVENEYKDYPAVVEEAKQSRQKLQSIIDELNEYMGVVYPEGLIDLGSGPQGQAVMANG